MVEAKDFADLSGLPNTVDDQVLELMMAEHRDLVESLRANEELGERRLDVYLTLIAATTAAIGLASSRFEESIDPLVSIASLAAGVMLVFGLMTLRRIMQRNITTSAYMNGLRRIRAFVTRRQPEAAILLPFPPERQPIERRKEPPQYGIGKGGLLETVAALNCALSAVAVAGLIWLPVRRLPVSAAAAVLCVVLTWIGQVKWAMRTYDRAAKGASTRQENVDAWRRWVESR